MLFDIKHALENLDHSQVALWGVKMIAVIGSAIVISYLIKWIICYFEKKNRNHSNIWNRLLPDAIKKPAKFLISFLAFVYAIKLTGENLHIDLIDIVRLVRNSGIIFCVSWFIWRIIDGYESAKVKVGLGDKIDITTYAAIAKLLKLSVLLIAGLMVLQTMGISIEGALAFGGVGGVVIGFAAKDLLANFFGAIMIFTDRPFLVGDWIRSPDRQIEGIVEYISWRLTYVRNFDKRLLYIPNSIFSTIIIENASRMPQRRINETVGIRQEDADKADVIVNKIREMLENCRQIDKSSVIFSVVKLQKESVNFELSIFTDILDYKQYCDLRQEVLLRINKIITDNNAQIAYPVAQPTPGK